MWFLLLRQTLIRGEFDKMKGISEKTLIKIKDLKASVKLNNGDMLTTVTNANMELQRGRSYAIVGKSGSGKTSLISIIGLLNREYEGEYLYDGISISALKDRDLSIVLERCSLWIPRWEHRVIQSALLLLQLLCLCLQHYWADYYQH